MTPTLYDLLADPIPPRAGLPARLHPFTDTAAAFELRDWLDLNGVPVRYSPGGGGWLAYDAVSQSYTAVPDDVLRHAVHSLIEYTSGAVRSRLGKTQVISNALTELRSLPGIRVDDIDALDTDPRLLCFSDGAVDLSTGDLVGATPADLITRCLPVPYEPHARAPRWERFVSEVLPDPDVADFVQRLIGYGITGETSEQKFAVLHGSGSNGKSVFIRTLEDVFDSVSLTAPFSTFEPRARGAATNDLARLRGARLVFASESESGARLSAATIKRVTGEDTVSARFLHREFFDFTPRFLLLLATNHLPSVRDQSDGFWRRVLAIPFTQKFEGDDIDPNLAEDLRAEFPGIAAWAVRGAVDWYRDGLTIPLSIRDGVETYRQSSDRLGVFTGTWLAFDSSARAVKAKDIWTHYKEWAFDNDEEDLVKRRTLITMLSERPDVSLRIHAKQEYLDGVQLLNADQRKRHARHLAAAA